METPISAYVQVVTDRPVERFLRKLFLSALDIDQLVIVSPFIGSLAGTRFGLRELCTRLDKRHIPIYVVTREPQEPYHRDGVDTLLSFSQVEVRYNPAIHAKLYVCWCREEAQTFALFGSGNLTEPGLATNIELGMMVFARGPGRDIVYQLHKWGHSLRMLAGTTVAKRRTPMRRA